MIAERVASGMIVGVLTLGGTGLMIHGGINIGNALADNSTSATLIDTQLNDPKTSDSTKIDLLNKKVTIVSDTYRKSIFNGLEIAVGAFTASIGASALLLTPRRRYN